MGKERRTNAMRPCKKCGQPIHFIESKEINPKTGKRSKIPCLPGEVLIVTPDGRYVRGYRTHWEDCPGANDIRAELDNALRTDAINQLQLPF